MWLVLLPATGISYCTTFLLLADGTGVLFLGILIPAGGNKPCYGGVTERRFEITLSSLRGVRGSLSYICSIVLFVFSLSRCWRSMSRFAPVCWTMLLGVEVEVHVVFFKLFFDTDCLIYC
jgi:hypothetical protein